MRAEGEDRSGLLDALIYRQDGYIDDEDEMRLAQEVDLYRQLEVFERLEARDVAMERLHNVRERIKKQWKERNTMELTAYMLEERK